MNNNDVNSMKQEIICQYEARLALMNMIQIMVPEYHLDHFIQVKKLVQDMIDDIKSNPLETAEDMLRHAMFTIENGEEIRRCTEKLKLKKRASSEENKN